MADLELNKLITQDEQNGDSFKVEFKGNAAVKTEFSDKEILKGSQWRTHPISDFEKCIMEKDSYKNMPKLVKAFYQHQNDFIHELVKVGNDIALKEEDKFSDGSSLDHCHRPKINKKSTIPTTDEVLAKAVFGINFVLIVLKAAAAGLSGSLSIISSLMDSSIDLISGVMMWWTAKRMKTFNEYVYPQGRRRLEPISIVVLSVVMAVTSIQLIRESIVSIIGMATAGKKAPTTDNISIAIISITIVSKIILWIVCYRYGKSESSAALMMDSRNDVFSNAVALICSSCSGRLNVDNLKYLDPCGAIAIAIYIMYGWIRTGYVNVKNLSGHTASAAFLQKVTFMALNHHPQIKYIDTVRAFHFGTNFLVEVDIILDENMILRSAHDIGESLQKRLETVAEIERCFVHLDYEFDHNPKKEHKKV